MTGRLRLSRLDGRDRRALRMGAWIVVVLLVIAFIIKPYASLLLADRVMLQRDRDLLARESSALAELPGNVLTLEANSQALLSIEPTLFGGSDAVMASAELARYVSGRATISGLRLEQVETDTHIDSTSRTGSAGTQPTYRNERGADRVRVTIRARGRILDVYAFLRAIETGDRLVRVERVDIVRGSTDDTFDGTLTLNATLAGIAWRAVTRGDADVEGNQ